MRHGEPLENGRCPGDAVVSLTLPTLQFRKIPPQTDKATHRVFVDQTGSRWELQIVNPHPAAAHGFTWVVADSDAQTRQPWIDLPAEVAFEARPGEPASKTVPVANLGTGPLSVTDRGGTDLGQGFVLTRVPEPVKPNDCGDLTVRFSTDALGATASADYLASSDDTTAKTAPGHNRRIRLSGTGRRLRTGTVVFTARNGAGRPVAFAIDPTTGAGTPLPGVDERLVALAVVVEPDGRIVIAEGDIDSFSFRLVRLDPLTAERSTLTAFPASAGLAGLVVEESGDFLVLNQSRQRTGKLTRVDRTTGKRTDLEETRFRDPVAMARGTGDRVFVLHVDPERPRAGQVLRVEVDPVTTFSLSRGGELSEFLTALASVTAETIVVARQTAAGGFPGGPGGLIRVDAATGAQSGLVFGGVEPMDIAAGRDGRIYVADAVSHGVVVVDPTTGAVTPLFGDLTLRQPFSITTAGST